MAFNRFLIAVRILRDLRWAIFRTTAYTIPPENGKTDFSSNSILQILIWFYLENVLNGPEEWSVGPFDSVNLKNELFAQHNAGDDIVSVGNPIKCHHFTQFLFISENRGLTCARNPANTISHDSLTFAAIFRGLAATIKSNDSVDSPWNTLWSTVRPRRWSKPAVVRPERKRISILRHQCEALCRRLRLPHHGNRLQPATFRSICLVDSRRKPQECQKH